MNQQLPREAISSCACVGVIGSRKSLSSQLGGRLGVEKLAMFASLFRPGESFGCLVGFKEESEPTSGPIGEVGSTKRSAARVS